MKYRSGWELCAAIHFDNDPTVKSYRYEAIEIPYVSNKRTKKVRNYIPDFVVTYHDERTIIIEVKRNSALNQTLVQKKAEAAKLYAQKKGWQYIFWTENIILPIQKIYKTKGLL